MYLISSLVTPDMSPLDYFVNSEIKKFIRAQNCANRADAERLIFEWLEDDQNQANIRKAILGSRPQGGFISRWRALWEKGGDAIQSLTREQRLTYYNVMLIMTHIVLKKHVTAYKGTLRQENDSSKYNVIIT